MPTKTAPIVYGAASLVDIANYQSDAERSLRLYYSPDNPEFEALFFDFSTSKVNALLLDMLAETNARSALVILARIEAAFFADYNARCKQKDHHRINTEFRKIAKRKKSNYRPKLEDEIWAVWRDESPEIKNLIGELKQRFDYRHWLAMAPPVE